MLKLEMISYTAPDGTRFKLCKIIVTRRPYYTVVRNTERLGLFITYSAAREYWDALTKGVSDYVPKQFS